MMTTVWLSISILMLILPVAQLFIGKVYCTTGRGYNTFRTAANPVIMAFASVYCGRLLMRWLPFSVITTIAAIAISFPLRHNDGLVVVILMVTMFGPQMFALLAPIFATQRALKFNFDANCNPIGDVMEGFDMSVLAAKVSLKTKLLATFATIAIIGGFTLAMVWAFIPPSITVDGGGLRISGIHGRTVDLADIAGIVLVEQGVRQIGVGELIDGHIGQTTLMGSFTAGLVLAQRASEGPTIRIDMTDGSAIFISRAEAATTRAVYQEILNALAKYIIYGGINHDNLDYIFDLSVDIAYHAIVYGHVYVQDRTRL